jgi:hypothetical protein
MRLAHHLLRHPSGMWHFRLTVPRDLHATLGLRVIKKSLGTHDPVAARTWAYVLSARYAQLFATVRGRGPGMAKQEWWDEERKTWIDFQKEPAPRGPGGQRKVVMVRGGTDHSVVDW